MMRFFNVSLTPQTRLVRERFTEGKARFAFGGFACIGSTHKHPLHG
ncbi:hypothetical protein [Parapedobacter lycopersici]